MLQHFFTLQIVYIWYDSENTLYAHYGRPQSSSDVMSFSEIATSRKEAAIRRQEHREKGVEVTQAESFDQAALFLIVFGLLICILNIAVLSRLVYRYYRQQVSIISLAVAAAHLIHLTCLLVYSIIRRYDIIVLNWMATMSISFANWSMLPLCLYVIVDGYFHSNLKRWTSNKIILLQLLILVILSAITPIPGVAEVKYFETPACFNSSNYDAACPFHFASLITTQTKVLPVLIHCLPLITSTALLIIGISKYKPDLMGSKVDEPESSLTEGSTVALLTTTWFLVYYFPTALLILVLKIGDNFEDQVELRASKGMIKMAMAFRILNTTANFFVNIVCCPLFRRTLCCRFTHSKCEVAQESEEEEEPHLPKSLVEDNADIDRLSSLSSLSVTFG